MTTITTAQLELLRKYLDEDAQTHIAAHGRWWLDAGKLRAALENAGIGVEGEAKPHFNYAVAIYCEMAGDEELPAEERLFHYLVTAENVRSAEEEGFRRRAEDVGTFNDLDDMVRWPYLSEVALLEPAPGSVWVETQDEPADPWFPESRNEVHRVFAYEPGKGEGLTARKHRIIYPERN